LKLCEGTLPVKMFSYMACGLPVILAVKGEAREVLEEARAGIPVEPEDPGQLAQAIMRLKEHPLLREEFGRNGRDFVTSHYDRKQLAGRLEEVLREVTEAEAAHYA
jgi:glycosyltransferase involved in cell wall biosynthesis